MTKTEEYDGSWNLYRRTENYFTTVNSPTAGQPGSYMVDRKYLTKVSDGAGRPYTLSFTFYDNLNTSLGGLSGKGDVTRVSKVLDLNPAVGITGQTLHTADTTTNYYDYWGNPTSSSTYPASGTAQYNGTAWTISAPSGTARTTTTGYDTTFHLYPITSTPPLVNVDLSEHANYDYRMGLVTSSTDANGNVTQATYDGFGRLATLQKPGDTASQPSVKAGYSDYEVPVRYEVSQIESINGAAPVYRLSEQLYDGMGRQIQTKVESQYRVQEIVTDKVYDGLGQVTKTSQPRYVSYPTGDWHTNGFKTMQPLDTDANERWTATTYDPVGRPLSVTAPDSTVSRNDYSLGSHSGILTTATDALSHRVSRENDLWGRLGWVNEYNGTSSYTLDATTAYSYSPLDQLTTVRDNKGNQTTITYDSGGRKTAMTDPDMGNWSYTFDPNGNMRTQTDAKNQTLTFFYDALDRLGGVSTNATGSAANSYSKNYAYDDTSVSNGKGRRTSMSNLNELVQWQYTTRGQVSQATYSGIAGMTGSRVFNWTYDVGNNISTIKVPSLTAPSNGSATDRETVTYAYDGAGRPYTLCTVIGTTPNGCYASSATYTALNQANTRAEGAGINKSWTYSGAMQRLSEAKYSGQGGSSGNLFDRTYTYDNVGNIQSIAAIGSDGLAGQTQNFRYDQRDRLSHAWTSGTNTTAAYDETDAYDELGNLTNKGGTAYSYPTGGQARPHTVTAVGSQAYTYDTNGNIQTGGGRTINWDVDNKPYSIMAGAMTGWESYKYDADGERMSRTLGSTTTVYLAGGMWEEVLGGELRSIFSFNGQAIAQRSSVGGGSGTVTYLHADHLGGATISTDYQGNNVQRQEFDPWGKVRSGGISSTSLNYTGQRLDSATGLLYYHARYYDPGLGKFLNPDTIVPSTTNPQAFNRYGYAYNNPLKFKDATGHRAGDYDNSDSDSSDDSDYNPEDYGGDYYDEPNDYDYYYTTQKAQEHVEDHAYDAPDTGQSKFPQSWGTDKIKRAVEDVANNPDAVTDDDIEGRTRRWGNVDGVKIKVVGGSFQDGEDPIITGFPDAGGYDKALGLSSTLQSESPSDLTFAPPPLTGSVPIGGQTLTVSPNPTNSSSNGTDFPNVSMPAGSNLSTTPLMGGTASTALMLLALLVLI